MLMIPQKVIEVVDNISKKKCHSISPYYERDKHISLNGKFKIIIRQANSTLKRVNLLDQLVENENTLLLNTCYRNMQLTYISVGLP